MSDSTRPVNRPPSVPEPPSARTDLRGFLADFETRMEGISARAEDSQARLDAVSATGASHDGEVTITVGAGGALAGIVFTSEVRRTSPDSLSEMVMEAYGKAVAAAAAQSTEAMTELLGEGTPALADFKASLRRRGEGGED